MTRKSLPGLVAELSIDIRESVDEDTDDVKLSVGGHRYYVNGQILVLITFLSLCAWTLLILLNNCTLALPRHAKVPTPSKDIART